jgi:hypothetical protein
MAGIRGELEGLKPTCVLTSEQSILAAEEKGQVGIERTDVVINCPIVSIESGGTLPGAVLMR